MKSRNKFIVMFAFASILWGGCQDKKDQITLYYSINEPMGAIARTVQHILEDELDLEVKTIIGEGSLSDINSIRENSAQLALIENHIGFQPGVNSLMPVYPQILHIFYKSMGNEQVDLKTIVKNKRVFIGHKRDGSHLFTLNLFEHFDIDTTGFSITENPFNAQVLIGFSDIISDADLAGLHDFQLYSFDDVSKFGYGSKAEGLALKFPKVKPFIIPKDTYMELSKKPLLTVSSDVVLVTNSQLDNDLAYDISKAIFRNLQEFNHISPLISQDLNENFDRASLSFPLHEGARVYLDRDEPTFLERYAELFGVGFSVFLALLSSLYSLTRWTKQRKKDRIDVFYEGLMKIKKISRKPLNRKEILLFINKIKMEQEKAFQMLVDEKLLANESFKIYMELSKETMTELKSKLGHSPTAVKASKQSVLIDSKN